MARVLLISGNFPPVTGGAAVVYGNICRFTDGAVAALAASHDYASGQAFMGIEAYDRGAGYPLYRVKSLRPPPANGSGRLGARLAALVLMAKVLIRTVAVARKEGADVICLGDLVYGGWLIFPLRYLFGYKIVVYVHGEEITTRGGGGLFDRWRAKFLAHAHAIIAVSSFTRDAMVRLMGTDPGKIVLIPNGVDIETFQVRAPSPDVAARYGVTGRRVILSVGRLVQRKGQDNLILAMPELLRTCPDAHLLIAGEGPFRPTLQALIRHHGLQSHVTLLGEVTDQALKNLYAQAEMFALPNREMLDGDTEGFGLVFLEANACGKPVLSGRAGGVVDAVKEGINGLTVDGADIGAISAALIRILQDKTLYGQLVEGGLKAAQLGDWRSRAAEFMTLCDGLRRSSTPLQNGTASRP